jgi:type I restriction enzyme S subunit
VASWSVAPLLRTEASWDVIPLQRLATAVVDCPHWTPEVTEDSGFEAVRSGSIRDGAYLPEESLSVSEDVFRARERGVPILPSDVLLAREAPAGEACLAPIGRRLCLGQRTVHVRVDRLRIAPELVIANIYCQPVRDYFKTQTNGSTVGNLRLPVIRRTPVIVPPLDIQPRLVAKYRDALAGIDHLTERADQFIRVSRERRAALITAAVTGQLDVSKGQVV